MTEHDPETGKSKATSSELKTLLEKYPLRVSYQDGHIEHLCLAAPENVAIINIKRGILSVFQNNMDDITKNQKVSEVRIEPDHTFDALSIIIHLNALEAKIYLNAISFFLTKIHCDNAIAKSRYLPCIHYQNQNAVAYGCRAATIILKQPQFQSHRVTKS